MRFGFSGIGRWGQRLITAFSKHGEIVACHSRGNKKNLEWLGAHYPRAHYTDSFDELVRRADIDVVIIASPIATHSAQAMRSLSHGKHVFVEKPLGTSYAECLNLVSLADSSGLRLFTGFTFLFDPAFNKLRISLVDDHPITAKFTWAKYGTFREPIAWNLLPHEFALALTLFDVERGKVVDGSLAPDGDSLESCLQLPADRKCQISITRSSPSVRKSIELTTKAGHQYLWTPGILHRNGRPVGLEQAPDPLNIEVAAFMSCLNQPAGPLSDGTLGAEVSRLVEEFVAASQPTAGRLV